jgi:hypothetical protein
VTLVFENYGVKKFRIIITRKRRWVGYITCMARDDKCVGFMTSHNPIGLHGLLQG